MANEIIKTDGVIVGNNKIYKDASDGGLFIGQLHKEGNKNGIDAVIKEDGRQIKVESGEAIITRKATKKHCKLLSKINQSEGGVAIPCDVDEETHDGKFEGGGKIAKVMREFKQGDLFTPQGKKVTSRKQAVAIGLSEERAKLKSQISKLDDADIFFKNQGDGLVYILINNKTIGHISYNFDKKTKELEIYSVYIKNQNNGIGTIALKKFIKIKHPKTLIGSALSKQSLKSLVKAFGIPANMYSQFKEYDNIDMALDYLPNISNVNTDGDVIGGESDGIYFSYSFFSDGGITQAKQTAKENTDFVSELKETYGEDLWNSLTKEEREILIAEEEREFDGYGSFGSGGKTNSELTNNIHAFVAKQYGKEKNFLVWTDNGLESARTSIKHGYGIPIKEIVWVKTYQSEGYLKPHIEVVDNFKWGGKPSEPPQPKYKNGDIVYFSPDKSTNHIAKVLNMPKWDKHDETYRYQLRDVKYPSMEFLGEFPKGLHSELEEERFLHGIVDAGKEKESNNELKENREVKIDDLTAISEVSKYHGLTDFQGEFIYSAKDSDIKIDEGLYELNEAVENAEQDYQEKAEEQQEQAIALDDLGYISKEFDGNMFYYILTEKAHDFIKAVDARIETRKRVNAGLDLFPEHSNIPELNKHKDKALFFKSPPEKIYRYKNGTTDIETWIYKEPKRHEITPKYSNVLNKVDSIIEIPITQIYERYLKDEFFEENPKVFEDKKINAKLKLVQLRIILNNDLGEWKKKKKDKIIEAITIKNKDKFPKNERQFISQLEQDTYKNIKYSKPKLELLAATYGIKEQNLIKELAELAICDMARRIAHKEDLTIKERYGKIVELYSNQVNLSHRTSESILLQQYSTPAPIAYLAGVFCHFYQEGLYFEPSAGNGLLTIVANPKNFIVNEIDTIRNRNLSVQGFKEILKRDATEPFKGFYKNFDGVITNPPFGKTELVEYGTSGIKSLEQLMALRALDTMKDNGRAAIIIGGHTEYDKEGRITAGKNRIFFVYLYKHYNVVDVINISGRELYSRQGTSFNVRLILIEGRKETPSGFPPLIENPIPMNETNSPTPVNTFNALWERVSEHF